MFTLPSFPPLSLSILSLVSFPFQSFSFQSHPYPLPRTPLSSFLCFIAIRPSFPVLFLPSFNHLYFYRLPFPGTKFFALKLYKSCYCIQPGPTFLPDYLLSFFARSPFLTHPPSSHPFHSWRFLLHFLGFHLSCQYTPAYGSAII